jgi:hypothetical protein
MDTILLVSLTQNTYERLDIFEDIPITLTVQQSDLTNFTSRRVPYSKTIQIPDTSNNALIFEHYFEVNGVDFNPLNKLPCVVQYRGTDIFTGVLRLNAVVEGQNQRLYEVFILGEVSDFAAQFRDLDLQDLEYDDLNHDHVYSAVTTSWEADGDGIKGLFGGKILYPLIHYGLEYSGETSAATPTFTYSFDEPRSFDQPNFAVPIQFFKPAIQVKDLLDRIFARTQYEVVSDFFDTDYFKAMYIDTFQNGKIGITTASAVTNQNIFRVFTNTSQQLTPIFQQTGSLQFLPINFRNEGNGGYDPLGNFTLGSTLQVAPTNEGYFRAPYTGTYAFNFRFNYSNPNAALGNSTFYIVANSSNSLSTINIGSFYTSPVFVCDPTGQDLSADLYFSTTLLAGEYVKLFILLDPSSNFGTQVQLKGFNSGGVTTQFPMWDLYSSPTITTNLVDMRLGVPNINCFEFLRAMITMFNLVIQQDETSKQIRIEPYNWYYDDPQREYKDWTNILDQNTEKRIEPLSFELSKDVIWTYRDTGFEYLPYEFYSQRDFVFGRKKFTTADNIYAGEQRYEVPFGSCPTSGITNAPNFIIPQFYYLINGQQSPYADKTHLFFWTGNRYAYKDALKLDQGSWYILSGSTPVEWTTYPCVSHLSILDSQFPTILSDLNFDTTFDFFGNSTNQLNQFTEFNVFNTFWNTYITNLYSYESRRLTGNFWFRPIDFYETQLNDKIWIKDAAYTIEKITDANLVDKTLTKISLIKETYPYYKIEPPGPIYFLEPNDPYPSPQPAFLTTCYYSFDKDAVCLGTAPIINVVSFGSGTLQNLQIVYYDTGTQYLKFPVGTYLRQLSTTDTFVVVDNYGRILENPC